MDVRKTIITTQTIFSTLSECQQNHDTVSLLVDQNGLTRIEGHVQTIHTATDLRKTKIELEEGYSFFLEEVIAVNGMFRSDYSEC